MTARVILLTYFEGGLFVMSEDLIQQALALLEEAGRLDLLTQGARPHARPARRASAGVVAAVAACSPPRRDKRLSCVRQGELQETEQQDALMWDKYFQAGQSIDMSRGIVESEKGEVYGEHSLEAWAAG
ncbi:hypothetical protein NDU88_001579 [Pleurodeles waltl]|uniref:Uncharacterized protein n=1 Tax=Pleurodeles waltl TaxID=8319 RepID=A0AAV7WIV2_PLEWA|nr:hypothetical protein NDU88_001579 [Pleurodeles waltl]